MNSHLDRARLLIAQSRFDPAIAELNRAIPLAPDDPVPHALLAVCLAERGEFDAALREARLAVQMAPDLAFAHYVAAYVNWKQDKLGEAETALREALRFDPFDPDHHELLSQIKLQQKKWGEALAAAEQGLGYDAEHLGCANMRAMALAKLGREDEARDMLDEAIRQDPENAMTHANLGWTALHAGQHKQALEHFRESLRLDPTFEWARDGMLEALKARHFLYRVMLRYFLAMSKLSARKQWLVILAVFFLGKVLLPLVVVFVFLSWTAESFFNLALRFNRYGRLLLSREQKLATNLLGGCLLTLLIAAPLAFLTRHDIPVMVAMASALMMIPIAGAFETTFSRGSKFLKLYAAGLGLLLILAAVLWLVARDLAPIPTGLFVIGSLAFTWVANLSRIKS
jgi:tetratricopeptide (TPR) repeat protein